MDFAVSVVILAGGCHVAFIVLICWWSCRKEGPCAKNSRRQRERRRQERRIQREARRATAREHSQPINEQSGETEVEETNPAFQTDNEPLENQPTFQTDTFISSLANRISRVGVRVSVSDESSERTPLGVRLVPGRDININIETDDHLPHYEEAVAMQISEIDLRQYKEENEEEVEPPPSYEDATKLTSGTE